MNTFSLSDFLPPVLLSLKVSFLSSVLVFVIGIWIAWRMSGSKIRGRTVLETLFMLPLVLPPTVVGFMLLMILSRKSWIGRAAELLFRQSIIFSWQAAVVAAVVVSFPLVYQTLKTGFLSIDKELQDAARSMGAGEWQVLRYITLPLSWRSLLSAYILGFARGLGEFGATLMVAGNIPNRTQTIPTAIYFAVDAGKLPLAWSLTAATIVISFLMLFITNKMKAIHNIPISKNKLPNE